MWAPPPMKMAKIIEKNIEILAYFLNYRFN
jgi:hypothetical protein